VKVLFNFTGCPFTIDFSEQLKGFDLIMAEEDYQYTSYIAYKAAKKYGIPIIVSNERYYLPPFPKYLFLKAIELLFTRRVRNYIPFITTHADSSKQYLQGLEFNKPVHVIHTAINTSKFRIEPSTIIKDKYNLLDRQIIVLTIGRLTEYKNYEKLIEQFSKLPLNYTLIIIGNGKLKDKLEEYISTNKILNVILETNFIEPHIIQEYINSCDVYIQPSLIEPFGIAVREAMVLGKPIIVTKEGGLIEAINGNGLYINKNIDNLKEAIDTCYKNRLAFGKQSIKLAKEYDVHSICKKYLELIK
jgi:glycosyltransferase involved in cell wall biosynthesis